MVDYSAERVLGSDEKKKEEKKDEEQPVQTRRSSRVIKPPMTFLDEANAKIESKQVAVVKGGGQVLPMEEEGGKYTHFVCSAIVLLLSHLTFSLSLFKGLPMDMERKNKVFWTEEMDNKLRKLEAVTPKKPGGGGYTNWKKIAKDIPGKSAKECKLR